MRDSSYLGIRPQWAAREATPRGLSCGLKLNHYLGSTPAVTPLVWEAYGTPHDECRKALGRIAAAAAEFGRMEADAFL